MVVKRPKQLFIKVDLMYNMKTLPSKGQNLQKIL